MSKAKWHFTKAFHPAKRLTNRSSQVFNAAISTCSPQNLWKHNTIWRYTPRKFNSSPLKNGGWKTILSYWVSVAFQGQTVKLQDISLGFQTPNVRRYLDPKNIPKTFLITAYYYKSLYNRVGFHPLFTLNNQGSFHCSTGKKTSDICRGSRIVPYLEVQDT